MSLVLFTWSYLVWERFRSTSWVPWCLLRSKVLGWLIRSPLSPESGLLGFILDDDEHRLKDGFRITGSHQVLIRIKKEVAKLWVLSEGDRKK